MRLRTGWRLMALGVLAAVAAATPSRAAEKKVLVIGRDASDIRTFDPARAAETTPPMILRAAYDTLVTVTPDDYNQVRPMLADSWEAADDGQSWVFHLHPGARFASGNPVTAGDVKFSFDRLKNLKDQPAYLADNLAEVVAVDDATVKLRMVDKSQPLLRFLAAVSFAVLDSKLVQAHGGSSAADADKSDTATAWLDNQTAGSGPYQMTAWQRNTAVVLDRNARYWGPAAGFQRVVIKYMADGGAQLLALKNGDIDVAFNLTPEQLATVKDDARVAIASGLSLDFAYMTLTSSPEMNPALAKTAARQAIAAAIDYDKIIESLLGGAAVRPASFLAIGMAGSTEELTRKIGYHRDIARAKALLAEAGVPDGFAFELSFPTTAFGGVPYTVLAQKIQSDLAEIGVKITLEPMTTTNFTSKFKGAKSVAAMWEWVPDIPDPYTWTEPAVNRVAKRVHWTPSKETVALMTEAAAATDVAKAAALNEKLLTELVANANYIVLFQPIYRVATSKAITGYHVTAAGWLTDLADIKPAP
ncbi:MAG: ABC transporter substrate-binding protein [Dongiaceae bacterium]